MPYQDPLPKKPYIVLWDNKTRVFGTYPSKEAARGAVEEKIKEKPQYTLLDFTLVGPAIKGEN